MINSVFWRLKRMFPHEDHSASWNNDMGQVNLGSGHLETEWAFHFKHGDQDGLTLPVKPFMSDPEVVKLCYTILQLCDVRGTFFRERSHIETHFQKKLICPATFKGDMWSFPVGVVEVAGDFTSLHLSGGSQSQPLGLQTSLVTWDETRMALQARFPTSDLVALLALVPPTETLSKSLVAAGIFVGDVGGSLRWFGFFK